jgi:uncharacterized membrane protein YphA (DoxX/SURF4 family)
MDSIAGIFAILLTLLYFAAGINKVGSFADTSKGLSKRVKSIIGLPLPMWLANLTIVAVIILEILGPIAMVVAATFADPDSLIDRIGDGYAWALIAFTALATLMYHFPTDPAQRSSFLRNLAFIGGFGFYLMRA